MSGYCRNADIAQDRYFKMSEKVKALCTKYDHLLKIIGLNTGLSTSPCNSYSTFFSIQAAYDLIFIQVFGFQFIIVYFFSQSVTDFCKNFKKKC